MVPIWDVKLKSRTYWSGGQGTLEASSVSPDQRRAKMVNTVRGLQKQQSMTDHQFTALEDNRRPKNLKIMGISEEIPAAEHLHLVQRLLVTFLSPKLAKNIALD
ncbi:Hypothetical predicted protein [Pelobates cultripes]|uniref:Uncharacterized protein n=1 Tax=Pelobates cultripes TaxID=61616 RepID=A0AAD1WR91_PELCU|nr:Hypothetical predicted protein [Pelobates cultripes]